MDRSMCMCVYIYMWCIQFVRCVVCCINRLGLFDVHLQDSDVLAGFRCLWLEGKRPSTSDDLRRVAGFG